MKLLLEISFYGKPFYGYQVQAKGPSVQAELNRAAEKLFGYPCDIVGCSRTDSGVHARRYYVTVSEKGKPGLCTDLDPSRIPLALSFHLPESIAVRKAEWVGEDFHPRYGVLEKTYRYYMRFSPVRDPFTAETCWQVPYGSLPDRLERMRKAAGYFVGTHDFASFMAAGSKIKDPVRTVTRSEVREEDEQTVFEVSADGFLYHMVRIFAGTLVEVAAGRKEPEDMIRVLEARDRHAAGPTAPAHGLFLWDVRYPES